jgi:predicted amino acid-binding ACT domain protein
VLAHVFKVLFEAGVNVEEVENIAYHGLQASSARIHVSSPPSQAALDEIRTGNPHIISVDLTAVD